jgi:hypothetical protein
MILLLATPLAFMASSSAADRQSALALWLSHPITPCAPDNSSSSNSWDNSPTPNGCSSDQASPADVSELHKNVKAVTTAQLENEEKDFFYDFTHDQIKQTHCEMNLLDALDQVPSAADAPAHLALEAASTIARALTLATADNSAIKTDPVAYNNQKTILENIWSKLPELARLKKLQDQALLALPAGVGQGLEDWSSTVLPIESEKAAYRDIRAKIHDYLQAKTNYHAMLNQVMTDSGSDIVIQKYTENLLHEKSKGLTHDQFMHYALQAVDPTRPDLSFQQRVVEGLRSSAIHRLCDYETFTSDSYERSMWNDGQRTGTCGTYPPTAGWSSDPHEQSNTERLRKRLLMETNAPLDFLEDTPKYNQDFSEFSCMLVGKYRKGPKIIHGGEQAGIFLATLGFGSWLKLIRAGKTAEEVAELVELSQSSRTGKLWKVMLDNPVKMRRIAQIMANIPAIGTEECSFDGANLPQTIMQKPVCEQIKAHDPAGPSILERNLKQTDCMTSIFLTAVGVKMLAAGPAKGAVGLAIQMIAPNPEQGNPEDAKEAIETILQDDPKPKASGQK